MARPLDSRAAHDNSESDTELPTRAPKSRIELGAKKGVETLKIGPSTAGPCFWIQGPLAFVVLHCFFDAPSPFL